MALKDAIEAINYTYLSHADADTLTEAYESLMGILADPVLNDENRKDAEALLYRLYGKIELTKYLLFPTVQRAEDLSKRLSEYIAAAHEKAYPNTEAVLEAAKQICDRACALLKETDEYRRKFSDTPELPYEFCVNAMDRIKAAMSALEAEDLGNPFRVGKFIDIKATLRAFADATYRKYAERVTQKRREYIGSAVKDITDAYSIYEYFPTPEYDEGGKAATLVVASPLIEDVKLFAVNAKRADKRLLLFLADALLGDALDLALEYVRSEDADILVAGLNSADKQTKETVLLTMVEMGKTGRRAFVSDMIGDAPLYNLSLDLVVKAGYSVTDISVEYLSVPSSADVTEELEARQMLARSDASVRLREMPFMGFMGLNKVVAEKITGHDWTAIGKRISKKNEGAARKYLRSLKTAYMFIDSGWGDFKDDGWQREKREEFDYDGVKEVDLMNVRKIVESDCPVFAKCGMIVRYCTTAGEDCSVWGTRSREEMAERLTLATELVFRLLGVRIKPEVKVLDELNNSTAGGLCCDGGKEIHYLYSSCTSWDWVVNCVVHESFHALQAMLTSGGWSKWYYDEMGITKGRVALWRETRKIYNDNTKSKVYKVHMYEADARAFEADCAAGRDHYWNTIDFAYNT